MSRQVDTIIAAIKASKKSRYRISLECGIDQGTLSRLVRGEANISPDTAEKIAEALDLEIIVRPKRRRKEN